MARVVALLLALGLSGCAVWPESIDDPLGMGAAMQRCMTTKPEDRTLHPIIGLLGPALACR